MALALQLIQVRLVVSLWGLKQLTARTACSSSLVALHLACNALRVGDAQAAIVGASNLILSHEPMIDMSMLRQF